jgi:hypothetical protein
MRAGAVGAAAVGLLLAAGPAGALQVSIDDGSGAFLVADGGPGDQDGGANLVNYDSAFGPPVPDFGTLSVQADGCRAVCESLGVSIEADTGGAAGAVTIEVTETGYDAIGLPKLEALHSVGGFADGTVTMEAFFDAGDAPFAKTQSIGGAFTFDAGDPFDAFAEDLAEVADGPIGPYSLTTVIEVEHGLGDVQTNATSAASVSGVPVPAAAWLLAAGVAGLGAAGVRRRRG